MNLPDITKLRNLLAAAPPTPWTVEEREGWWEVASANPSARRWPPRVFNDGSACAEYSASCSVESRDLIVAAVNDLPELLDEIERLKAELAKLKTCTP